MRLQVASLKHVMAYSLEQWSPDGNWSHDAYDRATFDAVVSPYVLFQRICLFYILFYSMIHSPVPHSTQL